MSKSIINDITDYTDFLRKSGYPVSLCAFDQTFSRYLPTLLRYEVHLPRICGYLKANSATRDKCVKNKNLLDERIGNEIRYGCCYAGVEEFVVPIRYNGLVLAAINISGYRGGCERSVRHARLTKKRCDGEYELLYSELSTEIPSIQNITALCKPYQYMFEALYDHCLRHPAQEDAAGNIYHLALDYIYNNYMNSLSATEIANVLNYSESYLRHTFARYAKVTLSEFILQTRLSHAAEMLVSTDSSITRIAADCGFSDANYFSTAFRRHFGMPPKTYRAKTYHHTV